MFLLFLTSTSAAIAGWTDDVYIDQTTRMAPALAFFNGQLNLVHASETDDFLYWSVYANSSWSTNVRIAKARCKGTGPALVATSSQLVLIHRGQSTDGTLWLATFSNNQWSDDKQMNYAEAGGKTTPIKGAEGIAAAGATDSSGKLFVVYRNSDDTVWYTTAAGTAADWTKPVQISGVSKTKTAPALTMMGGALHMQLAGTDKKIYDCVQNSDGTWTPTAIPDAKGTQVGSATVGGILYVVYLGESKEHLWFTSAQTSGWEKTTQIKDHDATYAPALAGDSSTNVLYMVHVGKGAALQDGTKLYFSQYTP